jgi:DNA replication protein DnaC
MMINETREKMSKLKLAGMLKALEDQEANVSSRDLSFEERLGLLIDREDLERENRKMQSRLRQARFKQQACLEDIDYSGSRGIEKSKLMSLADCNWVARSQSLIITGPTGVGKTYLACAMAHKACKLGYSSIYYRVTKLFEELALAKADGSYIKFLARIAKKDVLILDDWGLFSLTDEQSQFLAEIVEDRYGFRSTIITSQLPIDKWYGLISNPTVGESILDRITHNSHQFKLSGESMRKKLTGLENENQKG